MCTTLVFPTTASLQELSRRKSLLVWEDGEGAIADPGDDDDVDTTDGDDVDAADKGDYLTTGILEQELENPGTEAGEEQVESRVKDGCVCVFVW